MEGTKEGRKEVVQTDTACCTVALDRYREGRERERLPTWE